MNTSVQSDARERLGIMPNRYLAYASDETHGKAERAHVRRARGAGGASFAKKKPDLACRGSDLAPQVVGSNFVLEGVGGLACRRAAKSEGFRAFFQLISKSP